jgi:hypothetical protein
MQYTNMLSGLLNVKSATDKYVINIVINILGLNLLHPLGLFNYFVVMFHLL